MPNRAALLSAVMEAMTALNRAAAALEPRRVSIADEDTEPPEWRYRPANVVQHSSGRVDARPYRYDPDAPYEPDDQDSIDPLEQRTEVARVDVSRFSMRWATKH